MALVKVTKTKAYFKRFQTKFRRRRENKTDYQQRRGLIKQDKNKYNALKYRLVVRASNTKIVCQIVYATIEGDRVLCAAESTELKRYGVAVGLKNYAAAYCTGLLVARRLLKKIGLDKAFVGDEKATGAEYHVADGEHERRPFKCVLDIGLVRTTIGNRVFGALKGAVDGGLDIPHNTKRFPGYSPPDDRRGKQEGKYSPEVHRDRIFGKHVGEYMESMKDDEPEEYQRHFSAFIKAGVTPDNIEAMYKKAHAAIRSNPELTKKDNVRKPHTRVDRHTMRSPSGATYMRCAKMSLEERRERIRQLLATAGASL